MKIFINDIPVKIALKDGVKKDKFTNVIYRNEDLIAGNLKGKVLVWNASDQSIDELLKLMTTEAVVGLDALTFACRDKVRTVHYVKSKFQIIKAGGGIVKKDDKVLLIYRLEKWDLPKGKLESGESSEEGALREVEEETGVKVSLGRKITSTWHTYIRNKKFVLKKTNWYEMGCFDDSQMMPQEEEHIDKVEWMSIDDADRCISESYRTIQSVFKKFKKVNAENWIG